jgi:RNA polymerase sigma factor (sigma-70 family)
MEMRAVIRHLRAAALSGKGDGPTDGQLLECFILRRDEMAFEALVRRHGPMVLGVCRRVLRNVHDAEDAFQATFLVLARKAASVKPREMVGNWLYGVSYRTAMKARAMSVKRRQKERRMAEMSRVEDPADQAREEMLAQLDRELNRLPDRYRAAVVLCELEGKPRKEVAHKLGIPEGTLSSRLAQAKKLLGQRMSRYGSVAVMALLAESAASACLSPILQASTAKAALTAGAVSANVLALTEGVIKAMLLNKLKITACSAALMMLTGVGASGLTYRATAQQLQEGVAPASRPQTDELEALRLEIEALRKSLHATRERVKTLEDEVQALKRKDGAPGKTTRGGVKGMAPSSQRVIPHGQRGASPGGFAPLPPAPRVPGRSPESPENVAPLPPSANQSPKPRNDSPWVTGWDKPVDPDKDCKFIRDKGTLTIEVPGKDHDLGIERGLMNSPRLLRDVEGDFVAQVRVRGTFKPSQDSTSNERIPFVGAGLLLMADEKTYIRLERAALRIGAEVKTYANWELREDGNWVLAGDASVQPLEDTETYLRLERKRDKLLASVSHDGKEWRELRSLEPTLPRKLKIGVAAGGTSMDVFAPRFDQFQLKQKGR